MKRTWNELYYHQKLCFYHIVLQNITFIFEKVLVRYLLLRFVFLFFERPIVSARIRNESLVLES